MKKILSVIFLFFCLQLQVFAIDLKPIEDVEIELPSVDSIPELDFENGTLENPVMKMYTLKKGTTLELVSKTAINDRMRKGASVSFSVNKPVVTAEGEIIPVGTSVIGRVIDSHAPQIGANGGLVSLKINQINYKGQGSGFESKISIANKKRIFRNDLKGEHTYIKNYPKSLKFGNKVFKSSKRKASKLYHIPILGILSVVPFAFGTFVWAGNFMLSPVITLFSKGGSLNIPAGTVFRIKVTENSPI